MRLFVTCSVVCVQLFILGLCLVGLQAFILPRSRWWYRSRPSAVLRATGPDPDAPPSTKHRRREKKNKYKKFSKVSSLLDPLEDLIAESERKFLELEEEKNRAKEKRSRQPKPELAPLPTLEFPDTKTIDPYDPHTFGYIEIASVVGAHGVHGWIKVKCSTDFADDRLCTAGIRHLKPAKKRAPRQVVLLQGKHRLADEYLLQLEEIDNREAAQKLRGAILYVREEQKDDSVVQQEEYLVSDLVGLEVFLAATDADDGGEDNDKQFVGNVGGIVFAEDLCSTPGLGHDYLEVVLPRGVGGTVSLRDELVLIPLVPQIVPRVDIEQREIFIDPPAGLLDLTYVREEKTRIKGFLPSTEEGS